MKNRTEQLLELMRDRNLSIERVAEMLNRSTQTVRIWRCKTDSRAIPEHSLELLRVKASQQ